MQLHYVDLWPVYYINLWYNIIAKQSTIVKLNSILIVAIIWLTYISISALCLYWFILFLPKTTTDAIFYNNSALIINFNEGFMGFTNIICCNFKCF